MIGLAEDNTVIDKGNVFLHISNLNFIRAHHFHAEIPFGCHCLVWLYLQGGLCSLIRVNSSTCGGTSTSDSQTTCSR
jgi:hypothetical protein